MLDSLLIKEVAESDELEAFFLQALYWSIGAALLEDGRIKFDAQIKNLAALSTASDDEKNFAKAGKLLAVYFDVHKYLYMSVLPQC